MGNKTMTFLKRYSRAGASVLTGLALTISLVATAMCQTTSTQEGDSGVVDEIVTVGKKSLQRLQKDFDNAEAGFFDVYNSYNNDSRYEVTCEYKQALGSRRRTHECKAEFQREYEEELASGNNSALGGGQEFAPPTSKGMRRQQEIFRKKISDAISRHKKMREALNEFGDAKKALETERQKR